MFERETDGVLVRAIPEFMAEESEPDEGRFVWAYTIEIENHSAEALQLVARFWRITDANGVTQEVRGEGVVGEQPVILPGQSFSYTSAAPLAAPSGLMVGAYSMIRLGDGAPIEIAIPAFALDSPHQSQLAN